METLTLNSSQLALQTHNQRTLQHILCSLEFNLFNPARHAARQGVELLSDNLGDSRSELRVDRSGYTKQTGIGIAVVEAGAKVDGVVAVQDVGVESGVHAFTRAAYSSARDTGMGMRTAGHRLKGEGQKGTCGLTYRLRSCLLRPVMSAE